MTDVLNVAIRSEKGTNQVRRLRREGRTPAVLYGHGEANVSLSVTTADLESLLRHGTKMVDLAGEVTDKVLIRAVQWDAFGLHVLHVDLNRVSESERVEVTVPVDLRGEAPGAKLGGIVEQHIHDLEIECPAGQIPERIVVSIKELELAESITVGQLEVPPNVTVLTNADDTVVSCQAAAPLPEDEEAGEVPGTSEPEVIGRKAEDEEGDAG